MGRRRESLAETDSSWGAVRRGGARTTSPPLQTGCGGGGEERKDSVYQPSCDEALEDGPGDGGVELFPHSYLSKMTKSASLESRTRPAAPSLRINCTFSLKGTNRHVWKRMGFVL